MVALDVALVAIVVLLAVLVAGLLRSNAELTRAIHHLGVDLGPDAPTGAPTGVASPVNFTARPTPARPDASNLTDLAGATPTGDAITVAVKGVRHDTLVAFLTSGCATCRGFWDTFRTGVGNGGVNVPGGARLVVVTRGGEAESPAAISSLAGEDLPVIMSTAAWEHYDIPYAPYFMYISGSADRVVGEGVAAGWAEVQTLVANAVADGTTGQAKSRQTSTVPQPAQRLTREGTIDQALADAGILPGDPSLYPSSIGPSPADRRPAP